MLRARHRIGDDAGRIVIRRTGNEARTERPGHASQESGLRWFGHAGARSPCASTMLL